MVEKLEKNNQKRRKVRNVTTVKILVHILLYFFQYKMMQINIHLYIIKYEFLHSTTHVSVHSIMSSTLSLNILRMSFWSALESGIVMFDGCVVLI